jgi:hypothetical protein
MEPYKGICIKVYLNPKLFAEIAELAQKAGKRGMGLKTHRQKPHGFANQTIPNTKGIAKFFKMAAFHWRDADAERLRRALDLAEREKALVREKEDLRKRGVI